MREIKTDADGVPVWYERLGWKAQDFLWDFVSDLEEFGKAGIELAKNPFMILLLVFGGTAFAISAMGTWWWGW
jgi:hypothetical protein